MSDYLFIHTLEYFSSSNITIKFLKGLLKRATLLETCRPQVVAISRVRPIWPIEKS